MPTAPKALPNSCSWILGAVEAAAKTSEVHGPVHHPCMRGLGAGWQACALDRRPSREIGRSPVATRRVCAKEPVGSVPGHQCEVGSGAASPVETIGQVHWVAKSLIAATERGRGRWWPGQTTDALRPRIRLEAAAQKALLHARVDVPGVGAQGGVARAVRG